MTTFTPSAVSEALDRIVAEKGEEYVYPGASANCVYSQNRAPSCIVGHVVAALDPDYFSKVADYEEHTGESFGASELFDAGVPDDIQEYIDATDDYYGDYVNWVTPDDADDQRVRDALSVAQRAQDGGLTWGEAKGYFHRVMDGEAFWDVDAEVTSAVKQRSLDKG